MNILESAKKHWFIGILMISVICIASTWQTLNELLVKPRDAEINQLKYKISDLEKELAKKCSTHSTQPEKACHNKNRIALHSKKGKSDQRGLQIIKLLNNEGCIATGVVPVSLNIKFSDLRYFHESDLPDAQKLRNFIEEKSRINLTLNPIPELSYKTQKGYFEIWLK